MFLQQLALLEQAELAGLSPDDPVFVHRVVESCKLAMADRMAWYGDPKFVEMPLAQLLSKEYAAARWDLVGDRASAELRPGHPGGKAPRLPDLAAAARTLRSSDTRYGVGEPTFAQLAKEEVFVGDTCHIDVIDRHGNMIAATPSGGWLSSSPVVPEIGFPVTTRLQTSWLDEGVPNQVAPGKRPCTTLSPSFALKDG